MAHGRGPDRSITIAALATGGAIALDRHGVIRSMTEPWAVDWAAGAADGWHRASTDAAVRQSLVEDTPVVVSALRVPDGTIEQRCWAGVAAGRPFAIVELHNAAPVAVAVAVVIAPDDGRRIGSIDLAGHEVCVDERRTMWFSRLPSRTTVGTSVEVRDAIDAGTAEGSWPPGGARSADGDVAAGFVFPLPHTATLRLALALDDVPEGVPVDVGSMVTSEVVVSGWRAQTAGAPRIDLPERDAESAVDAARRHLLVHAGLLLRAGVDDDSAALAAAMAMALDEHGLHVTARDLLFGAVDTRRGDGSFGDGGTVTTATVLDALDRHRRLAADGAFGDEIGPLLAAGAGLLHRRLVGRRWRLGRRPSGRGGVSAADRPVVVSALQGSARSLRALGHSGAAALVDDHVRAVVDAFDAPATATNSDGVAALRRSLLEGAPCWTWPSAERGDDPWRSVEFLRAVRTLLVDDGGDGIDLLPGALDEWFGSPIAVHDLPTAHGRLSFALRWHGERPALLWDLAARDADPVRLSAPGLDPGWTSTEPRAEALLAQPPHEHRSFT